MKDKELGQLWTISQNEYPNTSSEALWMNRCETVIHKLVEERARNKRLQRNMEDCGHYKYPQDQAPLDRSVNEEVLALRDFGINPDEWEP